MATTTNYGWTTPDDTALVKDGAAAIRSLGTAIDTTTYNNAQAAIAKTLIDAKGDLIVGSAADTAARLAVGTNNYVLTADSAATNGVKWAAPAAGGKVLQVVSATTSTRTDVSSTTYTDSGVSASITPTVNTSKILILITHSLYQSAPVGGGINGNIRLMRDSTAIFNDITGGTNAALAFDGVNGASLEYIATYNYLDSPATTSSTTYKSQMMVKSAGGASGISVNVRSGSSSTITLLEIGA